METKHTPWPWHNCGYYLVDDNEVIPIRQNGVKGAFVADVYVIAKAKGAE